MEKKILVNLGPVDQIPLGQGMCFVVLETEIAVIRPRTGGVFAIENRCPHRQGPLSEGVIGNGKVVCPLHGHKFDLETGKGSDGQECVKVFKTWQENGSVMIEFCYSPVGSSKHKQQLSLN